MWQKVMFLASCTGMGLTCSRAQGRREVSIAGGVQRYNQLMDRWVAVKR